MKERKKKTLTSSVHFRLAITINSSILNQHTLAFFLTGEFLSNNNEHDPLAQPNSFLLLSSRVIYRRMLFHKTKLTGNRQRTAVMFSRERGREKNEKKGRKKEIDRAKRV